MRPLALCVAISIIPAVGCGDSGRAGASGGRGLDPRSSEALFQSAADTLNALDQSGDMSLAEYKVVVDRTTSTDKQAVLAVVTDDPTTPGEQFSYLYVPQKNVDFQKAGVRPGDLL